MIKKKGKLMDPVLIFLVVAGIFLVFWDLRKPRQGKRTEEIENDESATIFDDEFE